MIDVLDGVLDHYRATGLTERLKAALTAFGPEDQRLTPEQLAVLDQFHTRELAATAQLAELIGITADMSVLDVGSGVSGPARYLAATREAIESSGFRTLAWQDDTEAARAWIAQSRASGRPLSPNLGVVMGPDFAQFSANLGRNLMDRRLGILTAVFDAAKVST